MKFKRIFFLSALALTFSVIAVGGSFIDVTGSSHYERLSIMYLPTLVHEVGTHYYPMSWNCDHDNNVENNDVTYTTACPRTVYIHILKDTVYGYTFIQYWYYYAYNPFINRHKHDWELAMLVFDPAEQPVSLVLGAHGLLHPNAWNVASKDPRHATHPFIYVYAGSHAINIQPADPAPWFFERWSGGGTYTPWEKTQYAFLSGIHYTPTKFGDYPAPWRRSIWKEVPSNLDGARY